MRFFGWYGILEGIIIVCWKATGEVVVRGVEDTAAEVGRDEEDEDEGLELDTMGERKTGVIGRKDDGPASNNCAD